MDGSDDQALARARAGDREGFRQLVERHGRTLHRLAHRLTGNAHDAEDVVQETRTAGSTSSRTARRSGAGSSASRHRDAGSCCGGCRLEGTRGDDSFDVSRTSTPLEGPRRLHVLLRAERGRIQRVQRVRAFSQDCAIDVKPLGFVWLDGITGADSVAYLGGLLDPTATTRANATCRTAR